MNIYKIAFFVEGYTEQSFLKKLLSEIFAYNKIAIEIKDIRGGSRTNISYTSIETPDNIDDISYYVLIYNCGGDSAIKSYIMDRRETLIESGYKKIIGFRDVYPDVPRNKINRLIYGLNYGVPQRDIPIKFILSIMEIESWFLAEENHYTEIDINLTNDHITDIFNFNPESFNTELFDEPAKKLKQIYQSVGKTYKKDGAIIDRTIDALDYSNLYFVVLNRIPSFKSLVNEINSMFIS